MLLKEVCLLLGSSASKEFFSNQTVLEQSDAEGDDMSAKKFDQAWTQPEYKHELFTQMILVLVLNEVPIQEKI